MKKCYLKSIGCRTNQEETYALMSALRANDFIITDNAEDADIVAVNTCSVTSHTESKTRRYIQSIARGAPSARILVTGCFAQQHGEALLDYPNVKWVVGNGDKHRIAEILSGGANGGIYISDINGGGNNNNDGGDDDASVNSSRTKVDDARFWDAAVPAPDEYGRTRFSIRIQEGCDYRCAYCIVPSLRGRSRSAPKRQLTDIFRAAIDKGYKEIVLTGTHIGQYRDDSIDDVTINKTGTDKINIKGLESLLIDFLKIPGGYRVRLSSLDPRDLTDSLIDLLGGNERVCDHLHVSVQSFSAAVLARMGRTCVDLEALINRLRDFRKKYPRAGLGGDFIVGHPGETDAMFEETLRAVEAVGFTYGHVFRFSARRGTASFEMADRVPESVKKKRGEALRALLKKNQEKFLLSLTDTIIYIIVENGYPVRGVGGNYVKVEVPEARARPNTLARVVLTNANRGEYRLGKLL